MFRIHMHFMIWAQVAHSTCTHISKCKDSSHIYKNTSDFHSVLCKLWSKTWHLSYANQCSPPQKKSPPCLIGECVQRPVCCFHTICVRFVCSKSEKTQSCCLFELEISGDLFCKNVTLSNFARQNTLKGSTLIETFAKVQLLFRYKIYRWIGNQWGPDLSKYGTLKLLKTHLQD